MRYITLTMAIFAVLGGLDRIFGNKLGLGKEFEKAILMTGTLVLTMTGMLVLTPFFAWAIEPLAGKTDGLLDPSFFAGILFANDMGGAPLSVALAHSEKLGLFNGCVVASMMGATVSFTLPYALGVVEKQKQKHMLTGLLCGVVTVPVGCFAGGLVLKVPLAALLVNLLPLLLFSALVAFGLWKKPGLCVRIFGWFGNFIKALITAGLVVGIFQFLTGTEIPHTDTVENTIGIVLNVVCVLAGALPLVRILSKLLTRPLKAIGKRTGLDQTSTVGLFTSFATSVPMYATINDMNEKGITLNAAFSVSGAFVFADHMAFTMAFAPAALPAMIVGKLTAGVLAVLFAALVTKRKPRSVEKK